MNTFISAIFLRPQRNMDKPPLPLKPTVKLEPAPVPVKNEVVKEEVIKDEMIFEEEDKDNALQTVLNFSTESPSTSAPNNNDNNSSPCVNVPFTLITEKDKEIEQLKNDLEAERKSRKAAEEKVGKLVEFITFLHGQFGKLITSLVSLTTKSTIAQNTLTVGPFTDDRETNEFLDMLKDLSSQFQNELKNLASTKNLLERANLMLKIKPSSEDDTTGKGVDKACENESSTVSSNIELDPDLCALIGLIPCGTSLTTAPPPKTRRRLTPVVKSLDFRTSKPKSFVTQGQAHGVDYSKRHWGFVCLCGSKYASISNLNFHIKHFTAERKFECEICKKRFLVASQLKKHLRVAHNDGLMAFATSPVPVQSRPGFQDFMQRYQNHNATHALAPMPNLSAPQVTIQPVPSRPRPNNLMTSAAVVNSNSKTHGEDPTFINRCLCGKIYRQKQTLMEHITSHVNGKVFKCSMCPQRFTLPRFLKKHYLNAHNKSDDSNQSERRFECKECKATYPTQESLMVHCSIIHRNQGHNVTITPVNSINTFSGSTRVLPNHSRLPPPPRLISLFASSTPNTNVPERGSSLDFTAVEDEDGVICID